MCSLVSTQLAASNPASWAEAAAVRLWTALAAFTPSTAPSLSSGQSRCPLFLNLKSRIEKQRSYIQQFWQHLLASQLQATTAHASSSQRQKLVRAAGRKWYGGAELPVSVKAPQYIAQRWLRLVLWEGTIPPASPVCFHPPPTGTVKWKLVLKKLRYGENKSEFKPKQSRYPFDGGCRTAEMPFWPSL